MNNNNDAMIQYSTDLTEPFSQILCVTDSDATHSNDSSGVSSKYALIDLTNVSSDNGAESLETSLASKPNTVTNPKEPKESSCSVIELSDSKNSSKWLDCSTLRSEIHEKESLMQERLEAYFGNFPKATFANKSCVNQSATSSLAEDIIIDETPDSVSVFNSKDASKTDDKCSDEDESVCFDLNISSKININIKVTGVVQHSDEQEPAKSNQCTANQSSARKPFIDIEMIEILTDIYGDTWRTNRVLQHCRPTAKNILIGALRPKKVLKKSFLQSLDEKVPIEQCSEDALKYRTQFSANKNDLLRQLYDLYNTKVFQGKLNVPITWNKKLKNTAGRCFNIKTCKERKCSIELSDKVITSAERMRSTLIHEMCHAAAWIFDMENGHGKSWKNWTRLACRILPELPPITVCHQYDIEYKYTYKCMICSARYNAHSRSKKTENVRCAKCFGKIELFINKKDKEGRMVSTHAKQAKGFAKFVKQKYKELRETKDNHAETMKSLGEKFALLSAEEKNLYN